MLGRGRFWRPGLTGGAVLVLILLVGAVDFAHTLGRVPPIPSLCAPETTECNDARNGQLGSRLDAIRSLDEQYGRRAWIYSAAIALTVGGVALAAVVRDRSPARLRRVFANLGVTGVLLGLLGGAVLGATSRSHLDPPTGAAFFPCIALCVVAAVGGVVTRRSWTAPAEADADESMLPSERWRLLASRAALCAVAFTALTAVLAWVFSEAQPNGCGDYSPVPGWTGTVGLAAVASAIAAGILALAGLAAKRWFLALVCLVVNPAALVFMLLSTGIAC